MGLDRDKFVLISRLLFDCVGHVAGAFSLLFNLLMHPVVTETFLGARYPPPNTGALQNVRYIQLKHQPAAKSHGTIS